MSPSRPEATVQSILERHVDSFDKLEIAVTLARTPGQQVERAWLAGQLEMPPDVLVSCLDDLVRTGLLVATETTVGPADAHAVQVLDRLLRAYVDESISVMHALSEIAMSRIRGMAARTFASAFDLRAKRKGDRDG